MPTEADWERIWRNIGKAAGLKWRGDSRIKPTFAERTNPAAKANLTDVNYLRQHRQKTQVDCSGLSKSNALIKSVVEAGLVKVDTSTGQVYGVRGKPLRCSIKNGYYRVSLPGRGLGFTACSAYLHRILAYALFGDRLFEPEMTVDHINGDRLDNSPGNLRLIPLAENVIYSNQRAPRRGRNE